MLPVKSIYLVSLSVLLGAYRLTPSGGDARGERVKWVVDKTSSMRIAGRTNINKFCCQVTSYAGPDTLMTLKGPADVKGVGVALQGLLRIDINDFDCRNKIMTSEFKHTLKYQQYPQLIIHFLSLDRLPSGGAESAPVKGFVEIGLAGVCRRFEICYSSCQLGGEDIQLVGTRVFGFSDFGLQAPKRLGGLVKVEDQLDVQFKLRLHQVN